MLALILVSLLIIGVTTIVFFNNQNENYHAERLIRKEKTIIMSLQYFFKDLNHMENMDFVLKDFDYKIKELSDVNKIEINVFNLNGDILMSSKYDYTNPDFYTFKMNPSILNKLKLEDKRQVESINKSSISTYTFVKNKSGENIVIINIPYDTQLSPNKNELRLFLTTLLEVYIFLLLGASLIAYFLSNYITKSIRVVGEKLKNVRINKANEKINWESKDEIGTLVKEYNSMIAQLEESALKLAKSERESAWREMAKQVAHEIKNPLTPMKLSVQHLERSLDPNAANFKELLANFSKKIVQQIDTLTSIANEFSRFAKMPKLELKQIDLKDILYSTIDFFKNEDAIRFKIVDNSLENVFIQGDLDQLIRVFNNIINNAIQALSDEKEGEITLELTQQKGAYVVTISDNGCGIENELKEKIFQPNFTTKTTGTGLGLAMVKQIVDSHMGVIYFKSSLKKGTTFYIEFPIPEDEGTA
jgi:two-component system, NtrC family, nitrogen regulation sensor histidine kinase NtrY